MLAKLFNPITNQYIHFSYERFLEIDNRPLSYKDKKAIKEFKKKVKELERGMHDSM